MELDRTSIEKIIKEILMEKLSGMSHRENANGVIGVKLPVIQVSEENRLDTGKASDVVYTKDVLTLEESPRLGCGIMEMKETTFSWTLNYDEIDYVIEGNLGIIIDGKKVSAGKGELIFIPKGSHIQFSVADYARFLYVTYPADWSNQNEAGISY